MKKLALVVCIVTIASLAMAQGKDDAPGQMKKKGMTNVQWKCDKPSIQHSIPVGDSAGDVYMIEQIKCTAVKGDVAGVGKIKSGVGTEFLYIKGEKVTGHGEFVETMESGDKNIYKYEFTGTSKNGAFQGGTNKWWLTEGGGKLKGGKASGTCKATGAADQGTSFDCNGTYIPAGM